MICRRRVLVLTLLVALSGLAFDVRGGEGGINVIESDNDLLVGMFKREHRSPNGYILIKSNVVCKVVLFGRSVGGTFTLGDGGLRPYDYTSATIKFSSPATVEEGSEIQSSTFAVVVQKRDRIRCIANVLSGKRVLEEVLEQQTRTQFELSCDDALARVCGLGFSSSSIAVLKAALHLPDAADGGQVDASSASDKL